MAPTLLPNLAQQYRKQAIIQPMHISPSLEFKIITMTIVILVVFVILATIVALIRNTLRQRHEAVVRAEIEAQIEANAQSKGPLRQLILPTFGGTPSDDRQKPLLLPLMVSARTPRSKASLFTRFLGHPFSRNKEHRFSYSCATFTTSDGTDLETNMKADFAAQLAFGNVATLKSFGDWPVYIPRKTSSVIKFPETFSPTTSEGGYERTLSSRDSMKATWDKQERYENDSCPDISSVLDNPPSFSVGLSTTNQNMPSVLSRDRSVEHVEKNQSARSTPSPAADSSIVATPSHPLIYINAVSFSLLCFGQPKASHPNTRTRFPVSPDIDYLRAPPVNWAPHAVQELEPATEEASDISNVSRKAFILSAPPRGSGIGIGRAIGLGKGVGPVSRGVEAAAMIRSTLAPTGLGANSLRVVPDREESRYPTMSSPKTLKYEMLPVPPPVVTRRRPVGIIYGGSGSRSL